MSDNGLNLLPTGWVWTTVAEIGHVQLGRQRSPKDHDGPHMCKYLRVANVYEGRIDLTDVLSMNFEPREQETFRLHYGDVLLNEGQSLHIVGRAAIYRDDLPGACFQNTLIRFQPCPALTSDFALVVFRAYLHMQRFMRIAKWTTNMAHLGSARFAALEFPLPPMAEQKRITALIDSYLPRLDAAITTLERVQRNLKRYRASVLKAAVEGRLVPTEAELARVEKRDYEPASKLLARILLERRRRWEGAELAKMKASGKVPKDDSWKAKYEEPAAPDTSGLPELPEGWCWSTPEQLACSKSHSLAIGPFGSNLLVSDYRDKGVPLVFVRHVRANAFNGLNDKFVLREKALELAAHRVDPGDVVITKMGEPPGDAAVYPENCSPGVITSDVVKWTLADASRVPHYFAYATKSPIVHRQIVGITQGVAQKKISLERFRTVAYPLPPLAEQRRVVTEIDRLFSVVDESETLVEADLKRCHRLRQSILKWAFEGKLVDQDPNDEPASVLLERIRAERAATQDDNKKTAGRKPGRPAKRS